MSDAYDADLRALTREVAEQQGCGSFLQEGVYCMLAGPTYETIAESKVLQTLGADAVGEFGHLHGSHTLNCMEIENEVLLRPGKSLGLHPQSNFWRQKIQANRTKITHPIKGRIQRLKAVYVGYNIYLNIW